MFVSTVLILGINNELEIPKNKESDLKKEFPSFKNAKVQ